MSWGAPRLFGFEGVEGQLAELAGGEPIEGEGAEAFAVEREDLGAGGGEHAADLVIAALGEGELSLARGKQREMRGGAEEFLAGEEQRAAGEERDEIGREIGVDGGAIDLGDFVLRRGEAMHERGLVGEEEEAGGVFVEAADGGDDGIAAAPARREERVDVGAFAFVVGADEAEGFVEQEQEAVGMIERLAVDANGGGRGFLRGIVGGGVVHVDAAVVEPAAGFAAGAVTEAGEELVEAAHALNGRRGGGLAAKRRRGRKKKRSASGVACET